jgi:hypothetical protein
MVGVIIGGSGNEKASWVVLRWPGAFVSPESSDETFFDRYDGAKSRVLGSS